MSIAARLVSGSLASWAQIGITTISQLALVPIYLSFWSVQIYGVWLAIQVLIFVLFMVDRGHQEFLGFEFLRIGKENLVELRIYLWSGFYIGIAISCVQLILIVILMFSGAFHSLLGGTNSVDANIVNEASLILLLNGFAWLFFGSPTGLFVRALASFGYYPRMVWWSVFSSLLTLVAPAIAVAQGAGLLIAGIVGVIAIVASNIILYIDIFYLLRKEKINISSVSIKLGWRNFLQSLALSGKYLLENSRQHGVRLILAPLSGVAALAAFSTMRTGANVALQGLHTIANPLMPELMQFLHKRDQVRTEVAFGMIWTIIVVFMAPAVVILQVFIEPLYSVWTRGQMPFDPLLFSILSLTVLVYGVAQPAIAVTTGNNLLKPQLILSSFAAIIFLGGILTLVPIIGILGAAIALLAAEVVATVGYRIVASKWLHQNGLFWPIRPSIIASISVWVAALAMAGLILLPQAKWFILVGSMLLFGGIIRQFWITLPILATQRVRKIMSNLPGAKKLFDT
jgi:O-antigen/teichoic acid export membrane protein